jgi:hypothetical protein
MCSEHGETKAKGSTRNELEDLLFLFINKDWLSTIHISIFWNKIIPLICYPSSGNLALFLSLVPCSIEWNQ